MKIIDKDLLDKVSEEARKNERLRMNYNFHTDFNAKSQRLLNAIEPGTEVPVHRHLNTAETYILLRGSLNVFLFDDNKELISSALLNTTNGRMGVDIPAGTWHSLEVLETGTVIFEVKDGPYSPLTANDILK